MNISGRITTLRALEAEDLELMYRWENDMRLWRISDTYAPFSRGVLARLIEEQQYDIFATRQLRLVIESKVSPENDAAGGATAEKSPLSGGVVGAVDLFDFDPHNLRAGVGIFIDEPYRRRGFAADALEVLQNYARQILHLHQLWCSMQSDNLASISLFRGAGFFECGLRREWYLSKEGAKDELLMQKLL